MGAISKLKEKLHTLAKRLEKNARAKIKEADEIQLQKLASSISEDENWLERTLPLKKSDYSFIGAFIQSYCIADFNSRRLINAMRAIYINDNKDFAARLSDADVLLHLSKFAEQWHGIAHVSEGIGRAARTLEMHRIHRHHFAHWIIRRMQSADAFLMLTKNASEAEKRDGKAQGIDEAKWGLVMVKGLKAELVKLQGHSDYLGKIAVKLEQQAIELRAEYLSQKANKSNRSAPPKD